MASRRSLHLHHHHRSFTIRIKPKSAVRNSTTCLRRQNRNPRRLHRLHPFRHLHRRVKTQLWKRTNNHHRPNSSPNNRAHQPLVTCSPITPPITCLRHINASTRDIITIIITNTRQQPRPIYQTNTTNNNSSQLKISTQLMT